MGKFSHVLFASDFDHTLSDLHDQIPPENLAAIDAFIAQGGAFTIASGRSIPTLRPKAALVPTNAPCIAYNGAVCFDYQTGTISGLEPLPPESLELVAALRARFPDERVELQTERAHYAYGDDPNRDAYLRACGTPFVRGGADVPQPWLKIAVYGRFARPVFDVSATVAPQVRAHFEEIARFAADWGAGRCTAIRSGPRIVEIFSARCSKGQATRALAGRMGRSVLVCAGDAPNDRSMLLEADLAFCPADAEPEMLALPGVQRVAPCGGAAIADAIRRLEALL